MTNAPERIALKKTDGYETNWYGVVTDIHDERGVEYIRADLAPTDAQVMAHPKVRALVEATSEYRRAIDALDGPGSMSNKIDVVQAWRDALYAALSDLKGEDFEGK